MVASAYFAVSNTFHECLTKGTGTKIHTSPAEAGPLKRFCNPTDECYMRTFKLVEIRENYYTR